jgi:hypothetical protein
MHLFPYTFTLPLLCPGLAYGVARARAVNSLFSPTTRVCPDDGFVGSAVATLESFCGGCQLWTLTSELTFSHVLQTIAASC